jgi:hypothetical protein
MVAKTKFAPLPEIEVQLSFFYYSVTGKKGSRPSHCRVQIVAYTCDWFATSFSERICLDRR